MLRAINGKGLVARVQLQPIERRRMRTSPAIITVLMEVIYELGLSYDVEIVRCGKCADFTSGTQTRGR